MSSVYWVPGTVFSYKLRCIVGFGLVEMAISTNPKPTIYRNLYENTSPAPWAASPLVLLAPYIYTWCFFYMFNPKITETDLLYCCRCSGDQIIKYGRRLFFINMNICRHLKLEMALLIPASNDENRSEQFIRLAWLAYCIYMYMISQVNKKLICTQQIASRNHTDSLQCMLYISEVLADHCSVVGAPCTVTPDPLQWPRITEQRWP